MCDIVLNKIESWGGFLIKRSSAIRRVFAGFLRCDLRTTMKSFLKKIAREFSGNLVRILCKFPVNSNRILYHQNNFLHILVSVVLSPSQ